MHKPSLLMLSAMTVGLLVSASAAADETPANGAKPNVVTLPVTNVFGRAQRPTAAVEVSKVRMQLPPTTPTLAAVTKIGDAAKKDPF